MCGISGYYVEDQFLIGGELLESMNKFIRHRGPDDEGYVLIDHKSGEFKEYSGPSSPLAVQERLSGICGGSSGHSHTVGLAHRRFSIIDLSPAGHQPFFDAKHSCCVVFNGEIYNYPEIRQELESLGHVFRTKSDTEVLVEAYSHWGTDCFARFNGMWALALYDWSRRTLILSRDRLGKMPLYWTKQSGIIFFASEMKAFFQSSGAQRKREVNEAVILPYLALGYRDLNNTTFFKDIHSLPPGSWAVVDQSFPNTIRRFWKIPESRVKESDISPDAAAGAVREALEDSIRIRMRADVPWCVELSGGMDSSAIVAIASEMTGGRKLNTFTVRFPDPEWNEECFARSIADRFATQHEVVDVPLDCFWREILPFTYLEEEPYHAPNLHTNQLIRRLMRSKGLKMLLNGAGGDELFAGYNYYFSRMQLEHLSHGRVGAYLKNGASWSERPHDLGGVVLPLFNLAVPVAKDILGMLGVTRYGKKALNGDWRRPAREPLTLTPSLYADITNTKMPYWLRSGDKTHMGIPIEARAPFLDFRMVELAFMLPVTYLIRDGWHKWILRKAFEDRLPHDVVWRKQKMGFPFPIERFFFESRLVRDTIFSMSDNPYINLKTAEHYPNDWRTLSFLLWYELFFNNNTNLFNNIDRIVESSNHHPNPDGFVPEYFLSCRVA